MKAFIALALGCLATVCLQPGSAGNGGQRLRTLVELRDYLQLPEKYLLVSEGSRRSSSGVRRARLRPTYNGIPIRTAALQASQDDYGFYTGVVSGHCPTIPSDFDTSASQNPYRLRRAVVDYIDDTDEEAPNRKVKVRELKNFHYEKQILIEENGNPVLVYFVSALIERGMSDGIYIRYPRVLFRADDRKPVIGLLRVKKCHGDTACPRATGGNHKSGTVAYGPKCQEVCLNASVRRGNKCVLANDMVRVKSTHSSWKRDTAEVVSFDCDAGLDSSKGAAADAYYYAQIFYDVMQEWGGLERTQNEPHTLFVDFGDSYPNSFWDGHSTTFGDGIERTYHFATPEIIGHEMCHAVTDSLGNLMFNQQAAAIDEAFSDICGKAVTHFLNGENAGWTFAYNVMRNPNKALRYFDDPTRDGSAIAHIDQYMDNMDGYTAMGIYTKAFYSIVQEEKIPFRDAFETFVHANQIYWNEETAFNDGACGVLKSANDLGLKTSAFKSGFERVGIYLNSCDLTDTEDHIVSFDNRNREVRHAQISSSRWASYKVSSADASNVRVTLSCAGGVDTKMESSCYAGGVIVSHERSHVFPLSPGTTIVVSTDCPEISHVKVTFEFE